MAIVIGSAPWAIGNADRQNTQSAILFSTPLLTSVFMSPAYGLGALFEELKVTRRTGVLRGDLGRCGLVLDDVRKAACTHPAKQGMSSFHSQLTPLSPNFRDPLSHLTTVLPHASPDKTVSIVSSCKIAALLDCVPTAKVHVFDADTCARCDLGKWTQGAEVRRRVMKAPRTYGAKSVSAALLNREPLPTS